MNSVHKIILHVLIMYCILNKNINEVKVLLMFFEKHFFTYFNKTQAFSLN